MIAAFELMTISPVRLTSFTVGSIINHTNSILMYGIVNEKGGERMAEQVLIQFRADKDLKQDVADICDALGTDIPTVFRMCMKQIIITRGIPFSTRLPEKAVTREEAIDAFEEMRRQAADVPEMSLEEINDEIRSARAGLKARKAADR